MIEHQQHIAQARDSLTASAPGASINRNRTNFMEIKNKLTRVLVAATQSHRMQPALMTLAIFVIVLGVTGCKPHH